MNDPRISDETVFPVGLDLHSDKAESACALALFKHEIDPLMSYNPTTRMYVFRYDGLAYQTKSICAVSNNKR